MVSKHELKGILILLLIIGLIAFVMAAINGNLERFGINWFSPKTVYDKIAYVSDGDIWVMDKDGSNQTRLTEGMKVSTAPAVSPYGNRIAFVGQGKFGRQVTTVSPEGGKVKYITSSAETKRMPTYSPDGSHMAYIMSNKIFVASSTGGSAHSVLPTHNEIHAAISDAVGRSEIPAYNNYAWGPEGNIMIGSARVGDGDNALTYLAGMEDGDSQRFPPLKENAKTQVVALDWALAANVFAAAETADKETFLLVCEGLQNTVPYPIGKRDVSDLALSPDGTLLLFAVRNVEDNTPPGIYRIDLQLKTIDFFAAGIYEDLSFSPDGESLLATALEGDKSDIVLITLSDNKMTRLTKDGKSRSGAWFPMKGFETVKKDGGHVHDEHCGHEH